MRFLSQDRFTGTRHDRPCTTPSMAPAPYAAHLERSEGHPVLVVSGEIDRSNINQLAAALQEALTAGPPLVVDMAEVTFMGADGVRLIVETLDQFDRRPDTFVLCSPSRIIRWVLQVTRVEKLVTIVDRLDAAADRGDQRNCDAASAQRPESTNQARLRTSGHSAADATAPNRSGGR